MARLVRHEERGPLRIDENDIDEKYGDVAICLCGLSEERPFCDGTHRATSDEPDGLFIYDENGERQRIERVVYDEASQNR